MQFKELGLSDELLSAVKSMGFDEMTEIQEKSIPVIMKGLDIIGRSNTGTGKTAAFGIPVIEKILQNDSDFIQTLILCPTRELAQQACEEIKKFSKYKNWVKPLAIFGGVSIDKQIYQLKRGVNIIIGTPGRIIDHINRHTLKLQNLKTIVLDEADEMLQMGFREDIENILQYIPKERQTILFSATMPPEILAITHKYQNNPILIKTNTKSKTVESIEQYYYIVPMGKKFDALDLLLIKNQPKSSMIFCNTKKMVDELTNILVSKGYKAAGIHGDMKQLQRTSVMNSFKSGKTSILVATDVAARGIDVNGIDAVFNFDLPQDNEYYIHRIGRTGRAGKSGTAYTLVCNRKQVSDLNMIAKNTKSVIKESELPNKSELVDIEIENYEKFISHLADKKIYKESYDLINSLLEKGWTYENISVYLLNYLFGAKLQNIPDVKVIKYNNFYLPDNKNINKRTAKVNINLGKNQKINPNYILGALVDATGISGKSFGKINIHDNFTTVDVPINKIDYIVKSMKNSKINGNRVIVKKVDMKKDIRNVNKNKKQKNKSQIYKKG
ncbi:DEAD/DEAH box helicase [Porcipelethomonas ammoniilytica]|uniref:DEAD/DEAH box helicase n=1 Tax=Porcipelethomonas ammoniilytica TaxID=2981722 RepID=UPI0008232A8E|nr:DEAD/DEAH box helicase [Porcipelethomonas ammoniilytica]MCU6718581.1 DEAD/DEAH box helicase [Porcipelethomonas ammoniilytica]SCI53787.1 Probable DEAD-box ATP-dependent RNA helicase SA1885 [uncultured Ruminococcus sp.]